MACVEIWWPLIGQFTLINLCCRIWHLTFYKRHIVVCSGRRQVVKERSVLNFWECLDRWSRQQLADTADRLWQCVRGLSSLLSSFDVVPCIPTSLWFSNVCVRVVRRNGYPVPSHGIPEFRSCPKCWVLWDRRGSVAESALVTAKPRLRGQLLVVPARPLVESSVAVDWSTPSSPMSLTWQAVQSDERGSTRCGLCEFVSFVAARFCVNVCYFVILCPLYRTLSSRRGDWCPVFLYVYYELSLLYVQTESVVIICEVSVSAAVQLVLELDNYCVADCHLCRWCNTVCLKKTSPTFLAVTLESIVGFS